MDLGERAPAGLLDDGQRGARPYYTAWGGTRWHPFRALSGPAFFGWVVLAAGAYRSGVLGLGRSVALGLMSMLALGPLKGTQIPQSFIAVGGLCVAFVPLGVSLLRDGPRRPGARSSGSRSSRRCTSS
ncbi:hypothetical protein [Nonomuraea sp. NPDC049309]|uniref:hypothetical protein n=1 Tax=Nonomuraea sp. NPDC049309 TaxID=3364350 RepID=UPI0037159900